MSVQRKHPNPQRRSGQHALVAIRKDIPSRILSSIFKKLKKLLGKQLATMTSLRTRLVCQTCKFSCSLCHVVFNFFTGMD